jgi:hypothetical protein
MGDGVMTGLLSFGGGQYTVSASVGALPPMYSTFVGHAVLHEDFGIRAADGTALYFAVGSGSRNWPELVVVLRFEPGPEAGFHPGFLLIPESHLVFVGAGTCLLAYRLSPVRRLWEDVADFGFWGWKRHGDIVLMSAELELAAWDIGGRKLWSTFVEPPWNYDVQGDRVELDVMGVKSSFFATIGPQQGRTA